MATPITDTPRGAAREVEHEILVEVDAAAVFDLLADVRSWPRLFPPTVHVEQLATGPGTERIQIWATANGEAKTWVSNRTIDPDARRIEFRQEVTAAPVATMGGTWLIEPAGPGRSRVRLLHDYTAIDDDPAALAWIDEAVERNSTTELASLKVQLESAERDELLLEFVDTVRIDAPAEAVFEFLDRADLWTERLAHVDRVVLTEDSPGLQVLEMDTRTKDGSVHTTKSVRVCTPSSRIVYKQTVVPALMTLHAGRWELRSDGGVTEASSHHTVLLRTDRIEQILGAGAGVPEAREYVQRALSGNSRATLGYAKDHAENAG